MSELRNVEISESDLPLIEKLSRRHRDVLLTQGGYASRAQALNIPVGTVKSRLHRARKELLKHRGQE